MGNSKEGKRESSLNPEPVKGKESPETVFISYRHDGGEAMARLIWDTLRRRGYSVFMDVEGLRNGPFNTALFTKIESATDMVVVLTPGCLDRCSDPNDWVRLEVAHAIKQDKNVVPVMTRGFSWPRSLPEDLAALPTLEGVPPSIATKCLNTSRERPCMWWHEVDIIMLRTHNRSRSWFADWLRCGVANAREARGAPGELFVVHRRDKRLAIT